MPLLTTERDDDAPVAAPTFGRLWHTFSADEALSAAQSGFGGLTVVYVALIAGPPLSASFCGVPASRLGFEAFSLPSSLVTVAAVGAPPRAITTWTMLFLSRKVTSPADPLRVQPSGYFIE